MRAFIFALTMIAAVPAIAAEVYRSVDSDGVVTYSDRPDQSSSERINVVTATPSASRPAPSRAPGRDDAETRPVTVDGGEMAREATPAERAEERARNCEIASERAERYRNSRRLYRELEDGEREYLDDAQIDRAKADAEADVANWCS